MSHRDTDQPRVDRDLLDQLVRENGLTPSFRGFRLFLGAASLGCPGPLDLRVASCCREDGSIFCLGSPRRPTSTSLARFPRRPEHGTARARLLARAPSSKSRRAFVGKTSDATLLSSRGG